jgi:hypothetical protein
MKMTRMGIVVVTALALAGARHAQAQQTNQKVQQLEEQQKQAVAQSLKLIADAEKAEYQADVLGREINALLREMDVQEGKPVAAIYQTLYHAHAARAKRHADFDEVAAKALAERAADLAKAGADDEKWVQEAQGKVGGIQDAKKKAAMEAVMKVVEARAKENEEEGSEDKAVAAKWQEHVEHLRTIEKKYEAKAGASK